MLRFACFDLMICFSHTVFSQQYKNFKVSVYSSAYETQKMGDTTGYLKLVWDEITRQLKVDDVEGPGNRGWFLAKNNGATAFTISLTPHSFRVFKFE